MTQISSDRYIGANLRHLRMNGPGFYTASTRACRTIMRLMLAQSYILLRVLPALLMGAFLVACSTSSVVHPGGGSASQAPPGGIAPAEAPQFVQFGFDDNAISGREGSGTSGGVRFVRELFDGRRNPVGNGKIGRASCRERGEVRNGGSR